MSLEAELRDLAVAVDAELIVEPDPGGGVRAAFKQFGEEVAAPSVAPQGVTLKAAVAGDRRGALVALLLQATGDA